MLERWRRLIYSPRMSATRDYGARGAPRRAAARQQRRERPSTWAISALRRAVRSTPRFRGGGSATPRRVGPNGAPSASAASPPGLGPAGSSARAAHEPELSQQIRPECRAPSHRASDARHLDDGAGGAHRDERRRPSACAAALGSACAEARRRAPPTRSRPGAPARRMPSSTVRVRCLILKKVGEGRSAPPAVADATVASGPPPVHMRELALRGDELGERRARVVAGPMVRFRARRVRVRPTRRAQCATRRATRAPSLGMRTGGVALVRAGASSADSVHLSR